MFSPNLVENAHIRSPGCHGNHKNSSFSPKLCAHPLPNHNRNINHQSNVQVYVSKGDKQVCLLAFPSRKVTMCEALHYLYLDTYQCLKSRFFIRIHEKTCWGNPCRCSKQFVSTGASNKCRTNACFTPIWQEITTLGHLVAMATTKTTEVLVLNFQPTHCPTTTDISITNVKCKDTYPRIINKCVYQHFSPGKPKCDSYTSLVLGDELMPPK